MRTSYPHQIEGAAWLEATPKAILADQMRLGKTRTASLSLLNHLPAMIICPASAKGVWKDELLDLEPNLKIDVVKGRSHLFSVGADILVINYDVLGDHLSAKRFPVRYRGATLAVDECHRAKSDEARRTRATQFFIEQAARAVCMSGTPIPSFVAEFYPVLFSLGIVRLDYLSFCRRFAKGWDAPWGFSARGADNLDELQRILEPYLLRRTKQQVFGSYIPYESKLVTFDRPADSRESEFNKEHLVKFDNPLLAIEGLSAVIKESGLRKVEPSIEFIEDRLGESDKLVVFAYHKEVIKKLADGLKRFKPLVITGETSHAKREEVRRLFRDDSSCRVVIGNILAAGEAIDFSVADESVFVETTWVPKDIHQAAERTEGMHKLGTCSTAYFLTLENSIDHYMLKRIFDKTEVIDQIIKPSSQLNLLDQPNSITYQDLLS